MQIHTLISLGLAAAVCGAAIKVGDDSARRIGGSFLLGWLGSLLAYRANAYNPELEILAIDAALMLYFAWVSIRWRRLWALVASALLTLIVASHLATMIDLRVTIDTFNAAVAICSYGILACIAFGTWAGWRERRRLRALEASS